MIWLCSYDVYNEVHGDYFTCTIRTYRVPLKHAVSDALHSIGIEKKTPIEESSEDKGDKKVGHPVDERQPVAPIHHHSVPTTELPHPCGEGVVEMRTEPAVTAEQQLLLLPDFPPAGKVCICVVLHRNLCAVQQ